MSGAFWGRAQIYHRPSPPLHFCFSTPHNQSIKQAADSSVTLSALCKNSELTHFFSSIHRLKWLENWATESPSTIRFAIASHGQRFGGSGTRRSSSLFLLRPKFSVNFIAFFGGKDFCEKCFKFCEKLSTIPFYIFQTNLRMKIDKSSTKMRD